MDAFTMLTAKAVPVDLDNVDNDQVIPARLMRKSRQDGMYGTYLFHDLRFNDDGTPKPSFVLNNAAYAEARVLVGDRNFACGSSREHAVWSLYDYGFRAVIAPSFGDIFFNNSFQNGLLPIVLPAERTVALRNALEHQPGARIAVDLEAQTVAGPDGAIDRFDIDPFRKESLRAGADEIQFTLGHDQQIGAFEKTYERGISWL